MSEEPRAILDEAARRRAPCQVMPRGGSWQPGQFVRVDRAGVAVNVPGLRLLGGEDVQVWFSLDQQPYHFEASVLRAGVPVPDRGADGLLLGFIEGWRAERPGPELVQQAGTSVRVLPPTGGALELAAGPAQLLELRPGGLSFSVPAEVPLKFVEGSRVRLVFQLPDEPQHEVEGRVRRLSQAEGRYLYAVEFEAIGGEDELHLRVVERLRR